MKNKIQTVMISSVVTAAGMILGRKAYEKVKEYIETKKEEQES